MKDKILNRINEMTDEIKIQIAQREGILLDLRALDAKIKETSAVLIELKNLVEDSTSQKGS